MSLQSQDSRCHGIIMAALTPHMRYWGKRLFLKQWQLPRRPGERRHAFPWSHSKMHDLLRKQSVTESRFIFLFPTKNKTVTTKVLWDFFSPSERIKGKFHIAFLYRTESISISCECSFFSPCPPAGVDVGTRLRAERSSQAQTRGDHSTGLIFLSERPACKRLRKLKF